MNCEIIFKGTSVNGVYVPIKKKIQTLKCMRIYLIKKYYLIT